MAKVRKVRLGELCQMKSGATLTKRYTESAQAIPMGVVKMKHINHDSYRVDWEAVETINLELPNDDRILRKSDLLIVAKGERNTTIALPDLDTSQYNVPSNHFFILRLDRAWKKQIDLNYMVWFLNQVASEDLKTRVTGSTVKNLPLRALENIEVPLPDLATQQLLAETYHLLQEEALYFKTLLHAKQQMLKEVLKKLTKDE